MHKNQRCFGGVFSTLGLHGGLQFGFKYGGQVVPVFLEFTGLLCLGHVTFYLAGRP